MTNNRNNTWLPILLIAGAMVVWAAVLGIGAYLAPSGKAAGADYRKFLVIACTTGGFLLFWGLAMLPRVYQLRRQSHSKGDSSPPEQSPDL